MKHEVAIKDANGEISTGDINEMNFKKFESEIKKYECMKDTFVTNQDFETCIDNWSENYDALKPQDNENFITWCVDHWKI